MQNTLMRMSEVTARLLAPSPCSLHRCGNHLLTIHLIARMNHTEEKKETEKNEKLVLAAACRSSSRHTDALCVCTVGGSTATRKYPPCSHSRDPTGKCAAFLYPTLLEPCLLEPILARNNSDHNRKL
jgi:hypothetical protein